MCDVIVFQSDLMDVVFSFSHTFSQFLLNDTEIGLFTAIVLVTAGTTYSIIAALNPVHVCVCARAFVRAYVRLCMRQICTYIRYISIVIKCSRVHAKNLECT